MKIYPLILLLFFHLQLPALGMHDDSTVVHKPIQLKEIADSVLAVQNDISAVDSVLTTVIDTVAVDSVITAAIDTVAIDSILTAVKYTDEFLDTVVIDNKLKINDYSMIGFDYGVSLNRMVFNPKYNQSTFMTPGYFGISYTKYNTFLGSMPFFGYQVGLFYGHNGYKFKENEETGYISTIFGAEQVIYDYIEMPVLSAFHIDMHHFKILANLGPYVSYRLKIERIGEDVAEEYRYAFMDIDHRWDFGVLGGAGFGVVFNPFEFHLTAQLRYSFGNLFDPDYASKEYYRYASPFDIIIKAGLYFHLTKRTGKSRAEIKKEAKKIVFGE